VGHNKQISGKLHINIRKKI